MNSLAVAPYSLRQSRAAEFFKSAFEGSRALSINAVIMLVFFAVCVILQNLDARQFNGANVWMKPGKFFFSMTVHFLTIAWAMSLATPAVRQKRLITWSVGALVIAAWFELIYITFRAAQGEASHYSVYTPLTAALYALMGVGSVVLVAAAAFIALVIWRSKPDDFWLRAVALGFTLGTVLTLIVGFKLAGNTGHWIGGDLNDASGLPIFKWSTTGGDLRVSHFIALHAMQIVPLAALSGKRSVVWGVAIVLTIATVLTYFQALSGIPLLRP